MRSGLLFLCLVRHRLLFLHFLESSHLHTKEFHLLKLKRVKTIRRTTCASFSDFNNGEFAGNPSHRHVGTNEMSQFWLEKFYWCCEWNWTKYFHPLSSNHLNHPNPSKPTPSVCYLFTIQIVRSSVLIIYFCDGETNKIWWRCGGPHWSANNRTIEISEEYPQSDYFGGIWKDRTQRAGTNKVEKKLSRRRILISLYTF